MATDTTGEQTTTSGEPGDAPARTNADRLAETRARLLDAVVETLAECGYAATTTSEVARRSGLTRGAQLHHFGTKEQMMLATVEHMTARTSAAQIAAALANLPEGSDRVRSVLAIMSQLFLGELPAAYVELWVASRTNPKLAAALRATDAVARDSVRALFGEDVLQRAGEDFDALFDVTLYALRGMALDAHLAEKEENEARTALVVKMADYLIEALEP
jgi:AcrR family transcriptional regulator